MSYATAARISRETGVSVEWAPANREYVLWGVGVGGVAVSTAREARRAIARYVRRISPLPVGAARGGDHPWPSY